MGRSWGDAMKDPHTWNRRDFAVTPSGYFTILKPTRWFSAVHLPGGFRDLVAQSKETTLLRARENPTAAFRPGLKALDYADSQKTALPLQFTSLGTRDSHLMRPALIVLATTALTWILLWCTAHP